MPNLDSTFSLERLRIWNPDLLPPLRTPIGEKALSASASVPHSASLEQPSLLPTLDLWLVGEGKLCSLSAQRRAPQTTIDLLECGAEQPFYS